MEVEVEEHSAKREIKWKPDKQGQDQQIKVCNPEHQDYNGKLQRDEGKGIKLHPEDLQKWPRHGEKSEDDEQS